MQKVYRLVASLIRSGAFPFIQHANKIDWTPPQLLFTLPQRKEVQNAKKWADANQKPIPNISDSQMTTFQPKPPRILREVHVSTFSKMWKVNKVRCKCTYQSHSVDCKQTTAFNNPIHSGTSSLSGPVTSVANTVTGIMVVYTRPIQSFQRHLPSLWAHTILVANNQFSAGEPPQDMKFVKKNYTSGFLGEKIYTLKLHKWQLIMLTKNSINFNINDFGPFFVEMEMQIYNINSFGEKCA